MDSQTEDLMHFEQYDAEDNVDNYGFDQWRPHIPEFLGELMRSESGPTQGCGGCTICNTQYSPTDRMFRCLRCSPVMIQCRSCVLNSHKTLPLHPVQEWIGSFWKKATLQDLGLTFQLGPQGHTCPLSQGCDQRMTIIDITGIHSVNLHFCGCDRSDGSNIQKILRNRWYPATTTNPELCATFDALNAFRKLNVLSNVKAKDFILGLQSVGVTLTADHRSDRYITSFDQMARQYAFLLRLKRSEAGRNFTSVEAIAPGQCAVACWACPQEGKNLPEAWRRVDPKYHYLYKMILALDCGFHAPSRTQSGDRQPDRAIAPGSAYFVDSEPYKQYLMDRSSESKGECSTIQRTSPEKEISGLGGCTCARHGLVRAQGLGDLWEAETFVKMDYIFSSAMKDLQVSHLTVAYDFAGRWKKTFHNRMSKMPFQPHSLSWPSVTFGVLKSEALHSHNTRSLGHTLEHALAYQPGMGKTNEEASQVIWSTITQASSVTNEMTEGARHDFMDDKLDHFNFHKNISLGRSLSLRMQVALQEHDHNQQYFDSFDDALPPRLRESFMARVAAWQADPSVENPYLQTFRAYEEDARLALRSGETGTRDPRGFVQGLFAGMDIENSQKELLDVIRHAEYDNPEFRRFEIQRRRNELRSQFAKFKPWCNMYLLGVGGRNEENKEVFLAEPEAASEVLLPSYLTADDRASVHSDLAQFELRLRVAQCRDAIVAIGHHLCSARRFLSSPDATSKQKNIAQVKNQIKILVAKYRRARSAFLTLGGDANRFRDCRKGELEHLICPDLSAREFQRNVGSFLDVPWEARGGSDGVAPERPMCQYLLFEWAKSLALRDRSAEEIELVKEEMKRVIRFLLGEASRWEKPGLVNDGGHSPGQLAYGARQSAFCIEVAEQFRKMWDRYADFSNLGDLPE